MESFGYKDLQTKFGRKNVVQVLTGDRRQDSENSPMDSKSRLFNKTIMSVQTQLINLNSIKLINNIVILFDLSFTIMAVTFSQLVPSQI